MYLVCKQYIYHDEKGEKTYRKRKGEKNGKIEIEFRREGSRGRWEERYIMWEKGREK